MPSTHKKVVVRKMDRDSINGHVSPANFVREGKLELLNTRQRVAIDLKDIKAVYFVREFGTSNRPAARPSSAVRAPKDYGSDSNSKTTKCWKG
jgi:hypothetical protein